MDFECYLANRHLYVNGYRGMKEISAQQYANRFSNLVRKRIYNYEDEIDESIVKKINEEYVNKTSEYERTLKYYLEYKRHMRIQVVDDDVYNN
ncbi:hypothetical protein MHZ92_07880 [Sporosarcina sp. ACRSL]|uniref:hypothetical protein n=1 Tax=Sporosarcina sp. ACRSL TaxID=2918215 RepID=UPI001EF4AE85|nr:hypothetical protein [Sporosarcina sp. ACRSL]MCG7344047.1 hypothetical protein [Sporosarcina sp. ACRSL]